MAVFDKTSGVNAKIPSVQCAKLCQLTVSALKCAC